MTDPAEQRHNMVESQVRPSDVVDRRIVRAMAAVEREAFVPAAQRAIAYMDEAVPVEPAGRGPRRCLLAPRVFAKLVQLMRLPDGAAVLDIGGATGYSAAVLSHMAKSVIALEQDAGLAQTAGRVLGEQKIANVKVVAGPHAEGRQLDGPYDGILLNGQVPDIPAALLDQLKDGGRLVAILASGPASKAVVVQRGGTQFDRREDFDAGAAALPGFERAARFVF